MTNAPDFNLDDELSETSDWDTDDWEEGELEPGPADTWTEQSSPIHP